jgi:hypothetical protein
MPYKQIGKRINKNFLRKPTKDEVIQLLARKYRRELINRGIIPDPACRAPRFKFTWTYGTLTGIVYADQRALARALIKRELGLSKNKRLPNNITIVSESNEIT